MVDPDYSNPRMAELAIGWIQADGHVSLEADSVAYTGHQDRYEPNSVSRHLRNPSAHMALSSTYLHTHVAWPQAIPRRSNDIDWLLAAVSYYLQIEW